MKVLQKTDGTENSAGTTVVHGTVALILSFESRKLENLITVPKIFWSSHYQYRFRWKRYSNYTKTNREEHLYVYDSKWAGFPRDHDQNGPFHALRLLLITHSLAVSAYLVPAHSLVVFTISTPLRESKQPILYTKWIQNWFLSGCSALSLPFVHTASTAGNNQRHHGLSANRRESVWGEEGGRERERRIDTWKRSR